MVDASPLSWLHVSDTHFGHSAEGHNRIDAEHVAMRLAEDVNLLRSEIGVPDVVLLTGDFAWSANTQHNWEYEVAKRSIEKLLESAGVVDKSTVFATPGNHDVDQRWVQETASSLAIHSSLHTRPGEIDGFLQDAKQYETSIHPKFSEFLKFLQHLGVRSFTDESPYWSETLSLAKKRIKVCNFNSVLGSYHEDKARSLALGTKQIDDLLPSPGATESSELTLCLLHHPIAWLSDGGRLEQALSRRPHILFCGHLHDGTVQLLVRVGKSKVLQVVAGKVHGKDGSYAYHWGQLSADGLEYWPRIWSEDRDSFRPDSSFDLQNGNSHKIPKQELPSELQNWLQHTAAPKPYSNPHCYTGPSVVSPGPNQARTYIATNVPSIDLGKKRQIANLIGGEAEDLSRMTKCVYREYGCALPWEYTALIAQLAISADATKNNRTFAIRCRALTAVVSRIGESVAKGHHDDAAMIIQTKLALSAQTLLSCFKKLNRGFTANERAEAERRLFEYIRARIKSNATLDVDEFISGLKEILYLCRLWGATRDVADYLKENKEARMRISTLPCLFLAVDAQMTTHFEEGIDLTRKVVCDRLAENNDLLNCVNHAYWTLRSINGTIPDSHL